MPFFSLILLSYGTPAQAIALPVIVELVAGVSYLFAVVLAVLTGSDQSVMSSTKSAKPSRAAHPPRHRLAANSAMAA